MMTSLAPPRSRTLLLLPIVWIAGLFPAREAGALSLLCTNRPTVTQEAVATVAELLALDGSAIIVFSDDLDIPADRFESAFIIEVLDRPGIAARCGEFLGIDRDQLASVADGLRSRIGTMHVPVPGLSGGPLIAVGEAFQAQDRSIFLEIAEEGGALGVLFAIVTALGGDWAECQVDPQCYGLVDRL